MFQSLTKNLTKIFDLITSKGALSESQITEAMRDMRIALLESDVALPVVKDFIESVKIKALRQNIIKSISPGQMIIKIIHEELVNILSAPIEQTQLNLITTPPVNILMVGLQGTGKTTSSGKLALKLKNQNKKVLLVSLDTYRPAAQEQLEILGKSINVDTLPIIADQLPIDIANRAVGIAKLGMYDVVLYDTAGRLHIDDKMIEEVLSIKKLITPPETLLVVDAMTGQDAVNIASHFDAKLSITGIILSRIDGDSRGGAALSVKYVTGKCIKFLSTGEKLVDLQEFDPERIASRILDMGDVLSLVEKAVDIIDKEEAEKTAEKIKKGRFDLNDYLSQIKGIKKLGGMTKMLGMLPGINKLIGQIDQSRLNEKVLQHQEAIILSMTKKERSNPELLNASRRKRIASGSGTSIQQVNILLKQFRQISDLMKKAKHQSNSSLIRKGLGKFLS